MVHTTPVNIQAVAFYIKLKFPVTFPWQSHVQPIEIIKSRCNRGMYHNGQNFSAQERLQLAEQSKMVKYSWTQMPYPYLEAELGPRAPQITNLFV